MTTTPSSQTSSPHSAVPATPARTGPWRSTYGRLSMLQAVLALGFLMAAAPKLTDDPTTVAQFAVLGLGDAGMHVIGGLEVAGALALLVPRLCGLAALAFVALMIGAVAATVASVGVVATIVPAAFGAVSAVIAWARRDRTARISAQITRRVR